MSDTTILTQNEVETTATNEKEISRVLLVDDEMFITRALKRLLRRESYEVVIANSGQEAIELMEKQSFNLIISDQLMPEMTGTELLKIVRDRWPNTIRMILSGYSEINSIINAINDSSIYKYIAKPWNDEELRLHIRRALEQNSLKMENQRLVEEIESQNKKLVILNHHLKQRNTDANDGLILAQEMLDLVDAAVISIDASGLIVSANNQTKPLLEMAPPEIIGTEAKEGLPKHLHDIIFTENNLKNEISQGHLEHLGNNIQWRFRVLKNNNSIRGYIITLWKSV